MPDGIEEVFNVKDFIQAVYMGRVSDKPCEDDDRPALGIESDNLDKEFLTWAIMTDRKKAYHRMHADARLVHQWIAENAENLGFGRILGLELGGARLHQTITSRRGRPRFEVHSVRPARRQGSDGRPVTDLVVQITQKRRGYLSPEIQKQADDGQDVGDPDFTFRGGCTLVIDLPNARVRRCIVKDILSDTRLDFQRDYRQDSSEQSLWATYFGDFRTEDSAEPFAMMHRNSGGGQP